MKRITILIIMLVFTFQAYTQPCFSYKSKRTKYNFKLLKKGVHVDTNKIRIDGVYISEYRMQTPISNKEYVVTYSFTRFFPNGRVYRSWSYCSFPTNEELNELKYGTYGYYKVDSNRITTENYSPAGGYVYSFYIIEKDDCFVSYSTKKRESGIFKTKEIIEFNSRSFYFYPCKLNNAETFW